MEGGTVRILKVDAFTERPFTGNPAGVVTRGGEKLTDVQMQAIAREMNVAETAFLLRPASPGADVRIRWFTPAVEVPLCGHATVASFHAAAEEGSWGLGAEGTHRLRLECLSGILPVEVVVRRGESPRVRMGLPDPAVEDWADPSPAFAALGLPAGAAAPGLPAVRCGFYSLVPVRGLAALHGIRPDLKSVAAVTASQGGDGLIVVSLETVEPSSAVHVRMFAPAAGVDEDPVTGSAQGAVAGWLARIGYLGGGPPVPARVRGLPGGRVAYTAEQGDVLSRPGRIDVELTVDETAAGSPRARDVAIIGRAVTVMEGTIRVG